MKKVTKQLTERLIESLIADTGLTLLDACDKLELDASNRVTLLQDAKFILQLSEVTRIRQVVIGLDSIGRMATTLDLLYEYYRTDKPNELREADKIKAMSDTAAIGFKTFAFNQENVLDIITETLDNLEGRGGNQ